MWSVSPAVPETAPKAVKPKATAPRARPPPKDDLPRGAAMRWTPEEDAALIQAASENRGAPDKRSLNGIRWAAICRRAPNEYPLLVRHIRRRATKTLAKRYCQYLRPEEQLNKARIWR
jgi:hypothetical protein